jgi:hypothetical protein
MEREATIGKKEWRELLEHLKCYPEWKNILDYPDVEAKKFVLKKGTAWPKNLLIPGNNYIYVLMPNGEFRFPYYWKGDIHHPQLANRQPVIMAGVFGWSSEGLTFIDNKSGCYRPDPFYLDAVDYVLRLYGVPKSSNFSMEQFFH